MAKSSTTMVIDRIENGVAVCEMGTDRRMLELPAAVLPKGIREGDVLNVTFETNDLVSMPIQRKIEDLFNELSQ